MFARDFRLRLKILMLLLEVPKKVWPWSEKCIFFSLNYFLVIKSTFNLKVLGNIIVSE